MDKEENKEQNKQEKKPTDFKKVLNIIGMILIVIGIILFIIDYFGDIFDNIFAYNKAWKGKRSEAAALRLGLTKTNIIRSVLPYIFFIIGFIIIYFNQPEQ
jgi:preprotein translocase subunit Sss1